MWRLLIPLRSSVPAVVWHLAAYALVLAGVGAMVPLDACFGSDDGAYGGQVWALRHGSWVLDRPLPVVDAGHEGWLNGAIVADGPVPYSTNPAWVRVLEASAALVHGPGPGPSATGSVPPAQLAADAGASDFFTGAAADGAPGRKIAESAELAAGERAGDLGLGLHLPGLVAALVAAGVAWRLARRWDRRAAPVAFWLVALGPMLVDTTTLWAHSLGTACGGLAVLAVAELWPRSTARSATPDALAVSGQPDGPDPFDRPGASWRVRWRAAPQTTASWQPSGWRAAGWRLLLLVALAAGAAVRTEAVFWTAAVVVAAVAADRSRAMVATALAGGTTAAVSWGLNRAWGASLRSPRLAVETSVESLGHGQGWLASRLPAAWQLLGTWPGSGPGQLLSLAGLALTVGGAVVLRRNRADTAPSSPGPALLLLVAATAMYLVKAVVAPDVVIPGLLAAWPVVLVALVAGRWPAARSAAIGDPPDGNRGDPTGRAVDPRWLLAPVGLMAAAVLATQYESSGGLQWGGRYLSMAYVPLAAAAALALVGLVTPSSQDRADRPGRPTAALGLALAALAVAPAVSGVATSLRLHSTHAMIVELTTTPPAEVVVTNLAALPRIGWIALPTTYYRADADTLAPLLADLAQAGVGSVNVAGLTEAEVDGVAGWRLASTNADPHGTVRHLTRT